MCQNIKYIQLKSFFIKQQILMLRMYIYQLFAQLFHLCQRSRSIVDECPALTGRLHFTTQNALFIIFQLIFFEKRAHTISRYIKTCLYYTLGSSVANRFHIGTLS